MALRRYRLPEAVLLGHLKRGKKERASAVKAASSRRNGAMPVRPGSRGRGRPTADGELRASALIIELGPPLL